MWLWLILFAMIVLLYPLPKTTPPQVPETPLERSRRRRVSRKVRVEFDVVTYMNELSDRFQATGDWTSLVDLASIYDRGWYPQYRPNWDMASMLFTAGTRSPNPDVSRHCSIWLLTRQEIPEEDMAGIYLPALPGYSVLCAARQFAPEVHLPRVDVPRTLELPAVVAIPTKVDILIPDDPQNVHDHGVMKSLQQRLRALPSAADTNLDDVRAYVLDSDASPDTKQRALETLESLTDTEHSTLGVSELEALGRVWTECRSSETKDILVSQLASGVENDSVVCSTGKIGRLVGTLDGLDDDSTPIRPMWAVREEISRLAASVRDEGKDADEFRASCFQTYVTELEMSPEVVSSIVEEYAAHI